MDSPENAEQDSLDDSACRDSAAFSVSGQEVRFFSLSDKVPDVLYTHPLGFVYLGTDYPAGSWTGFLVSIAGIVRQGEHGDLLDEVQPSDIEFTNRYCIGITPEGMIQPKRIDDTLWIETNFCAKQSIDFAKWLTDWCGVDQSKVVVTYARREGIARRNRRKSHGNEPSPSPSPSPAPSQILHSEDSSDESALYPIDESECARIKRKFCAMEIDFRNTVKMSMEYTKPLMLHYGSQWYKVSSWKEFISAFAERLARYSPFLDQLRQGTTCLPFTNAVLLSQTKDSLRKPHKIADDLYIETNLSADHCLRHAIELGKYVGINYAFLHCSVYYTRAKITEAVENPRCIQPKDIPESQPASILRPSSPQPLEGPQLRAEFISECAVILAGSFPYGMRKDSVIERNKFCRKYEELTGQPPAGSDLAHLWEACCARGVVVEDKVFPLSEMAVAQVKSVMDALLASGNQQGYYTVIFDEHQQELCDAGIGSAEILAAIMRKVYPGYEYSEHFFRTNRSVSAEDEVLRVLKDHDGLTLAEIQQFLPGMPEDRLCQVCRLAEQIVKDADRYFLLDNLQFDESETEYAIAKIKEDVQKQDYALLREIDLDNSASLNGDISLEALRQGFFQRYLSSDFKLKTGVVSDKNRTLSVRDILRNYSRCRTSFTLTELNALYKELTGDEHIHGDGLRVAQELAIQVDADQFVQPEQLDFDIDGIDDTLETLLQDGAIPLLSVSAFMLFPAVSGFKWNHYLLASYCRSASRRFGLLEQSISNSCNGLIVHKADLSKDYYHAVAELLVKAGIPQDYGMIGDYAVEHGMLGYKGKVAVTAIMGEMEKLSKAN